MIININIENDDALDWAAELEDSRGATMLKEAFGRVEKTQYPESPDCCIALAAAEIVAAAKGNACADLPAGLGNWLQEQPNLDSIQSLEKAAIRILNKIRKDSELKESWQESEDWRLWNQVLDSLQKRLKS